MSGADEKTTVEQARHTYDTIVRKGLFAATEGLSAEGARTAQEVMETLTKSALQGNVRAAIRVLEFYQATAIYISNVAEDRLTESTKTARLVAPHEVVAAVFRCLSEAPMSSTAAATERQELAALLVFMTAASSDPLGRVARRMFRAACAVRAGDSQALAANLRQAKQLTVQVEAYWKAFLAYAEELHRTGTSIFDDRESAASTALAEQYERLAALVTAGHEAFDTTRGLVLHPRFHIFVGSSWGLPCADELCPAR